jgi:hypothetical protein
LDESSPPAPRRQDVIDAIEDENLDPCNVTALLDRIPDAYEQAQLGLKQAGEGNTISLDEL